MTEGRCDSVASTDSMDQHEDDMSSLLRTVAELNVKMNALQSQQDPAQCNPMGKISNAIPELDSSTFSHSGPSRDAGEKTSMSSVTVKGCRESEGGSGGLWAELQGVLSTLESSINRTKVTVTSQHLNDEQKQAEHLSAAQESWVQATQVLEEMEREFGISYPSALPSVERQKYQQDILTMHKLNQNLRSALQSRQEELNRSEAAVRELDEEKRSLKEKFLGLKRAWLTGGSSSPPCSSSGSSSRALSPCWTGPPRAGSPMTDASLPGTQHSPDSLSSPTLETEVEGLQRLLERLKVRNERLNAALKRRKGEAEQISMTLSQHEADSTALQMALKYCEECEDAYSSLLSLYEAGKRKQQTTAVTEPSLRPSGVDSEQKTSSSTSSPPEGAVQTKQNSSLSSEECESQAEAIRQRIVKLKQDRAAVCVPEPGKVGEGKLSPDTGTLAGPRATSSASSQSTKAEKAALLYELVKVREEMWELRNVIGLMEKERRSLEWTLQTQNIQDAAAALLLDSLKEELQDWAEQKKRAENRAQVRSGGGIPGPRSHAILRELQAVLQREQMLKRRAMSLRGSLDSALADCSAQRRHSREEVTRLALCHSKATSTYRSARRKHHEQLWQLEQQMAAMSQRHVTQEAELKAALEVLEGKREETVL
ncbi:colorectal mutant cancer protein [Chanos chanos]|uniref:Colorectal mutant cancer protein n=1 Tax=Chanos chanos TaxID=29144 RepID=A0A6J2W7E9_CHACN|nr:colorectal mutant cancer protein-like [Chanos chanos]